MIFNESRLICVLHNGNIAQMKQNEIAEGKRATLEIDRRHYVILN